MNGENSPFFHEPHAKPEESDPLLSGLPGAFPAPDPAPIAPATIRDVAAPDALTEATVEELERAPQERTWVKSALLLAISIGLFALSGFFNDQPENIALLIAVIFFHELGHYVGMRLFNYQDVRMFFIPFFGAAVAGRSRSVLGYKEAIVLLLGPLPGIVLGAVLGIAALFNDSHVLRSAAALLLLLNSFNLLPLMPLDGGRLLHLVLFSRQPILEAIFRVVTGGLVAWLGWSSGSYLFALFGVFMILGSRQTYRISQLAHQLRGPLLAGTEMDLTAHIPREQAIPLVELVRKRFASIHEPKQLANLVRQVWERIHLRPPGIAATLLFLVIAGIGFLAAPILFIGLSIPVSKVVAGKDANGGRVDVLEVRAWGRLKERTELNENQLPHGRHVEFQDDSPAMKIEGAYKHGLPEGAWSEFDKHGQVVSVRHFREGKIIQPPD